MSRHWLVRIALGFSHLVVCVGLCCAPAVFAQGTRTGEKMVPAMAPVMIPTVAPAPGPMRSTTQGTTLATQPPETPPAKSDTPPKGTTSTTPTYNTTPPTPREDSPTRPVGPMPVEEVRPEVYYLKNKDGELEPVLGFTYEDFYRLFRLDQKLQQGAKPPTFRFEKASLVGKVENGRAKLRAEFQIVAAQAGWTRVPLGLTTSLLADGAKDEKPREVKPKDDAATPDADAKDAALSSAAEQMIQFDASEGYVLWLNGKEGESHTVVFERLLTPVVANGDDSRLRLILPRSLTSAELRLTVPVAKAQVKSSDAAAVISTKAAGDTATEISLTARGGELELSWRAPAAETQAAETRVVEATSAIRATIDDRAITWDAQLTVRSLREPLESFDVRLPQGAQLEPVTPGAYTVSVSGDSPRVLNVALRKATTEPVTLRLLCRRSRDAATAETIDFAGFSVVDATRQSGAIVVSIDGDWRIAWRERSDVRDTERPPESLAPPEDQQSYSFEFFRQPFTLQGEISQQPTRLDVEPQYQVTVEADQMRLTAHLIYKVRGAKVSQVQLQLGNWEVDEIGPAGVVHSAGTVPGENGMLTIPLAQRMRSTFELAVTAKRPLAADSRRIDFSLPTVTADVIAPPVLVIESADNVDLMPVEAELSQLTARSGGLPATMKLEKRRHPPLVYRALGEGRDARFVAQRTLRTREVTAESMAEVNITETEATVEQHIDMRVAYEALNRIVLELPEALADRRDIIYSIDGGAVMPIVLDPTADTSTATSDLTVAADSPLAAKEGFVPPIATAGAKRIALEPLMAVTDRCRVTIRYSTRADSRDSEPTVAIPLVTPVEATVLKHAVRVASASATQFSALGPWETVTARVADAASLPSSASAEFRATAATDTIVLKALTQPRHTTVHTAWIRTTVSDGMRQDRVVFRVETDEPRLEISLPVGARADRIAAWVDQKQVSYRFIPASAQVASETPRPSVELAVNRKITAASRSASGMRSIELLYNIDGVSSRPGEREWEPPAIVGDVWQARTLWEVVMPASEHVVADPDNYTPEYAWRWIAAANWSDVPILPMLSRHANQSPAELQRLTGAMPLRITDGQTNRYLFSANGPAKTLAFRTLSRSTIVLLGSSLAIALGLAFVYVPSAKRPLVLLLTCVALAGIAVWSPVVAILGAQAAAVGLVVALLAGLASFWLKDRTTSAPSPVSTHSDRFDRGSSASRPRREDRSQATTLTVPAELDAADMNS